MTLSAWIKQHYVEKGPVRWLAFSLDLVGATILFGLMALTCVDVVGRYLFASPVHGSVELTEIGLAFMVFAVMPVVTWRGSHVVVDLMDHLISKPLAKLIALLTSLLIATSLYFLAFSIFELGARSILRGVVTEYLGFPSGYIVQYIAIMIWATVFFLITYSAFRILFQDRK